MPKLSDLGLSPEKVGQETLDYATMPDQMGGFTEPPQPGNYRFKFPQDMVTLWDKFEHQHGNPPGVRIKAKFDSAHPLTIIQSPGGALNGEPFETSITNAERKRGKKDDPTAAYISDMDYILRDVFGNERKPATNVAYIQEMSKHAGAEMSATVTWNWFCNPSKNIYVDNGQDGSMEVEGKPGCGAKYYQKQVDKVLSDPNDPSSPKVYPLRISCATEGCGANIRAFANLEQFKA